MSREALEQTIIIGAGAAGLAAAAELLAHGHAVILLEARGRTGGRVHTVRDATWEFPLEFGAEFIHGRPAESWNLVHQQSLHAYDVTNTHWMARDGQPRKDSQAWEASAKIMKRLADDRGPDQSFTDFLKDHCQQDPVEARVLAKAFVEGLDAADAAEVSAKSLAASEADGNTFDADTPFRLVDGYDTLLASLVASVETSLHLSTIVRSVEWSPDAVTVRTTDDRMFSGARLIVTVPIGVLRAQRGEVGATRLCAAAAGTDAASDRADANGTCGQGASAISPGALGRWTVERFSVCSFARRSFSNLVDDVAASRPRPHRLGWRSGRRPFIQVDRQAR